VYILEFTRNEKLWYLPESNSIILKIWTNKTTHSIIQLFLLCDIR
jgi:hypothetical protein